MRGAWKRRAADRRAELVQHRLHQRRVERVARPAAGSCGGPAARRPPRDGLLRTGEHHRGRPVDRRDAHLVGELRRTSSSVASTASISPPSGSACISRARADTSAHASASDSTPATCAAAISPTEWPASEVRPYAQGLDQPEQRHLDREQGGLGELRPVQGLLVLAPDHVTQAGSSPARASSRAWANTGNGRTTPGPCRAVEHPGPRTRTPAAPRPPLPWRPR